MGLAAHPPPLSAAAVAETHSAIVFFVGDRAYKLKKAVDLGFLDFRRRAARAAACAREVELNRRLAPDVYLGVADVLGPDGRLCDHLVVMRRMPADRRLATLVAGGADVSADVRRLGRLLAAFHAGAERSEAADRAAGRDALAGRWAANTAGLLEHGVGVLDLDEVREVDALAARYLAGRAPLFARRVRDGRAVDGHGDLLADDIFLLPDGPRVLDCLEFDDALRLDDGLADVAFLAMDLERLGRPDLAAAFLAAYRQHAGDSWPASLERHHVAYRAQVRAKVAAIRARQGVAAAADEARAALGLAHRHLEAGRVRLVVVGGLPGTGKSTLAAGLGDALGATVLRSDGLRKELAALPVLARAPAAFGEGIYRAEATAATYREMLRRAGTALGLGESVVLDASWTAAAWRAEARALAVAQAADLVELRCTVPEAMAARRLQARARTGADPSDATADVAARLAAVEDPWPGAERLDTTPPVPEVLAKALALVAARPINP